MAVAADWIDRALAGVGAEALSAAGALVAVKPKVPAFYPPIRGAAALVPVGVEPVMAEHVAPLWTAESDPAYIGDEGEYGNSENDLAALRGHLAAAVEWGGVSEFAALVMLCGVPTTVRLTGSEAAIRQALPDADTVRAWREAGVMEFPMQLEPGDGSMRRITWVPIDQVPTILQMERAWRGEVVRVDGV